VNLPAQRIVDGFARRHDVRLMDTLDRMGDVGVGMVGKRLRDGYPIADNGMPDGALAI